MPLVLGFHGGGDSSMFFTFVSGWWEIAHKYGFLFVSIDDHLNVSATEAMEVLAHLKQRYNIDEKRIYATGFSMGSGKTWDMFQEYPEVFAGLMPASALFPMKNNNFGKSLGEERAEYECACSSVLFRWLQVSFARIAIPGRVLL